MCRFSEALDGAVDELSPKILTDYLYDLSVHYNEFYTNCQVRGGPAIPRPRWRAAGRTAEPSHHGPLAGDWQLAARIAPPTVRGDGGDHAAVLRLARHHAANEALVEQPPEHDCYYYDAAGEEDE